MDSAPPPWDQPNWLASRLKELCWQGLSWPYLIGIGLTGLFAVSLFPGPLAGQATILRDTMLLWWGVAFGKRILSDKWQVGP